MYHDVGVMDHDLSVVDHDLGVVDHDLEVVDHMDHDPGNVYHGWWITCITT